MDALQVVKFGDTESLNVFLFENGVQHKLYWEQLTDNGIVIPKFPVTDADPANLDDWLQTHQVEHQGFADALNLDNPFNLLDVDFNVEVDFYDWISTHYLIHVQIAQSLGF